MTKLSDTQALILSAAAKRPDGNVLPLPGSLRGGAAIKVVTALLGRGLIRQEVTDRLIEADPALNTIWRTMASPDHAWCNRRRERSSTDRSCWQPHRRQHHLRR